LLAVTAKQIVAADRATLNGNPEGPIRVVEKAGFNRASFIAEVRRALLPLSERAADGQNTRH
jgi:hypothetical protein